MRVLAFRNYLRDDLKKGEIGAMAENVFCEDRLKKYGEEAFMRHREEVCLAVRTVCFCLEFLQNEENWSGRKASRRLNRELKERKWRAVFW